MHTFKHDFIKLMSKQPGAVEHRDLADFAENADTFIISPQMTKITDKFARFYPHEIEKNIDVIQVPKQGLWLEWDTHSLSESGLSPLIGNRKAEKIAAILIPRRISDHEMDEQFITVVICWTFSHQDIRHSYACSVMQTSLFEDHAEKARKWYSNTPVESQFRLLNLTQSYIPPNFSKEIEGICEDESMGDSTLKHQLIHKMFDSAHRDVTSELVFVFSLLVLMHTKMIAITTEVDETHLDISVSQPSFLRKMRYKVFEPSYKLIRKKDGFVIQN